MGSPTFIKQHLANRLVTKLKDRRLNISVCMWDPRWWGQADTSHQPSSLLHQSTPRLCFESTAVLPVHTTVQPLLTPTPLSSLLWPDLKWADYGNARLNINGSLVDRVDSFKYVGVHITEGLTWALQTDSVVRQISQRLFLLLHHWGHSDEETSMSGTDTVLNMTAKPCKEWFSQLNIQ